MTSACLPSALRTLAVVSACPSHDAAGGPFAIGQIVGNAYAIGALLAKGGMGVVYEARDLALGRRVAIKAPLDPRFGAALRREAQALASIHCEAFVTVYHLGKDRDVEFMVMERIVGETLAARIDAAYDPGARPIALSEVLDVLVALASALVKAHEAGVTQRDLKPANVILAAGRVVLVDFGLFVPEVLVGPDNEVSGSPDYVAPEVLRRDVARGEGPLVDLYALGALAFELLTGETPFLDPSLSRTLKKHLLAVPRDVCALRDDVPRALGDLVSELLAKDPKQRPVSAEAVLWELFGIRRALQDRPSGPPPPPA